MVVAKQTTSNDLTKDIELLLADLGGLSTYINAGDRVLLKPNFNTGDPFPASSDLAFLKAVVELVYAQGATEVIVADSSTIMSKTSVELDKAGVFSLRELTTAPIVVNLDNQPWTKRKIPNARYLKNVSTPQLLDQVDKLIYLPCCKTHFIAQFTGSLKLSVGLMKRGERVMLHARHLHEKIAELNTIIHPDLIIMDARKCFINGGPEQGEIKEPHLILASTDRSAIDIEAIQIIQSYAGNSLANVVPNELAYVKYYSNISE